MSNGIALTHRGDWGLYAIIDQQIWRPASGEPDKGIGVFTRLTATPSDRNLVDSYIDGGIVFAGMIPGRPDDVLSFSGYYAHVSNAARALSVDQIAFGNIGPLRTAERQLEINYQAQIMPGWQVDLDLQRVFSPGGGAANPASPTGAGIPDASIVTLHTQIKY